MLNTYPAAMTGPQGKLEVDIDVPAKCTQGIAFLAHPLTTQGGTKDHKVLTVMSKALRDAGYLVVRPNLRGAGGSAGSYGGGAGETEDFLAVIRQAFELRGVQELLPAGGRVLFGGFSFGTFVALMAGEVMRPSGMLLAGAACGVFDMPRVRTPAHVVHGEKDEIVALGDVLRWAEASDLAVTVMPGADHFFTRRQALLQRTFARCIATL